MKDILGEAIKDYFEYNRNNRLWVIDTIGPKVEMPISYYFRSWKEMPDLEKKALESCRGKTLDIGAGAGSHSLELQNRGIEVYAVDISAKNVEVMKNRKVRNAFRQDIFTLTGQQYDTLLLMMNGIGLCGTLQGFRRFLKLAKSLLLPNGQLIFDSSNVSYLFEALPQPIDHYFGEIKCRYEYKNIKSDWLTWLYIDEFTIKEIAMEEGWTVNIIAEDKEDQFLVKMEMM